MKAAIYTRVSLTKQAGENKVSVKEQEQTCNEFAQKMGAEIAETYIDAQMYRKTKTPKKGKMVEPSGKYDDRPGFLAMLNRIEQGDIDCIIAYDISRVGRHTRVLGTLSNSLDIGQSNRQNDKIKVWEASKHTALDGIMLNLMISFAQQENESRMNRMAMGRMGTLKQNRWPGRFSRLGYTSVKDEKGRGHKITLGSPGEVQIVRDIFQWATKGFGGLRISEKVRKRGFDIDAALINKMLSATAYYGDLVYTFKSGHLAGQSVTVKIPPIVTKELWDRVQQQKIENTKFQVRNTKSVFLAQHIAHCGTCGRAMSAHAVRYYYRTMADGTRKRYERKYPLAYYLCNRIDDRHKNRHFSGLETDALIWQELTDTIRNNPDKIIQQTNQRAKELREDSDNAAGSIAQLYERLTSLDKQEMMYHRQLGRGKLSEDKYDVLIGEIEQSRADIESELQDLIALRDETEKVKQSLDFASELLKKFSDRINEIDLPESDILELPTDSRIELLKRRQQVVRALVDRIVMYPDRIELYGAIGNKTVSLIAVPPVGPETA